MALNYPVQQIITLIGSKSGTTRTSVTLTDAYGVANKTTIFPTGGMTKVNFSILYTMGATETTNSVELRLESSSDGTNFYRIPNEAVSAGTSTLTLREFPWVAVNAAPSSISLPLDLQDKYMRISVKETGVVTNFGTIYVEAIISGK